MHQGSQGFISRIYPAERPWPFQMRRHPHCSYIRTMFVFLLFYILAHQNIKIKKNLENTEKFVYTNTFICWIFVLFVYANKFAVCAYMRTNAIFVRIYEQAAQAVFARAACGTYEIKGADRLPAGGSAWHRGRRGRRWTRPMTEQGRTAPFSAGWAQGGW